MAYPSLQTSAAQPSPGMNIPLLNTYQAWLATKLSASDAQLATNLLWCAVDPVFAISPSGQAAQAEAAAGQ